MMLTVTENAKQLLRNILLKYTDDPEVGLRLSPEPSGQVRLVLSKENTGDQVVEHGGAKVLLLEQEVIPLFDNATLDVQDSPEGPTFQLSMLWNDRN